MSESLLKFREAESALFKCPVYAASISGVHDVDACVELLQVERGALLVARVPLEKMEAVQRLESFGGRLCDVLLTLTRHIDPTSDAITNAGNFNIRLGNRGDADELYKVGLRSFAAFHGHWHSDARLPHEHSDRLYAQWSAGLARDASELRPLFIAESGDGQIAGYLALVSDGPRSWYVPLTCVDPAHRGKGGLAALLRFAINEIAGRGGGQLSYETQLHNGSALRAVVRSGFIPSSSRLTFHLWSSAA